MEGKHSLGQCHLLQRWCWYEAYWKMPVSDLLMRFGCKTQGLTGYRPSRTSLQPALPLPQSEEMIACCQRKQERSSLVPVDFFYFNNVIRSKTKAEGMLTFQKGTLPAVNPIILCQLVGRGTRLEDKSHRLDFSSIRRHRVSRPFLLDSNRIQLDQRPKRSSGTAL